jgi:hypothetical protein
MSKVTIAGDVNGTGVFTLAAPNGNTNRTLTLPDEAGTVLTSSTAIGVSQLTTGMPFNMAFFYNNTRTGLSVQTGYTLWSVTYNKKSSTSIIAFDVQLAFREAYNGEVGFYVQYGSSGNSYRGCSYMELGGGSSGGADVDTKQIFRTTIDGYTTTGTQTVNIGWLSNTGSSNMPSSVWNPTNADEPRGRSPGSTLVIWEIEP